MAAMLRSILVLALAFGAASCTTVPRSVATADFCGFEMHRAEVALPPPDRGPLLTAVEPANAMLLLSDGSLHGAFGAGVLARWKELNGGLPRFRAVTRVSTGALLSTDAFIDRPEAARQAYSIERESQLLTPYARRNAKGGFNATGYLSIVRNNAVADLAPLRAMLHDHISMDVLKQVVERAWGRRLLVGAADVDSGDAVVFDMLDMARKAVNIAGPCGEHFRNCYIDAIVASSSVPLAAKPVVIDNRMYIDGGARFGVFLDAFGSEAGLDRRDTSLGPPPQLYILVNGMQRVKAQCGKIDGTLCAADGTDPFDRREGAHAGWNLLGLAQRSSDILVAQIYRFSAADIIARYRERYGAAAVGNVHYFQIESDEMLAHPFRNSTCAGLHEEGGGAAPTAPVSPELHGVPDRLRTCFRRPSGGGVEDRSPGGPRGPEGDRRMIGRHTAALAAFVLATVGGSAAAQTGSVAVGPAHLDGEATPATDISGMACAEPDATGRLCLAVDDETGFAQWVTFQDGRLSPGKHVALVPMPLGQSDLVEARCHKGASDKGDADGEAVAYLAPHWYVIGSHGCSRKKNQSSPGAFRIYRVARGASSSDASTARIALALRDLSDTSAFAERCLQPMSDKKGRPVCAPVDPANGVNVEGLAATPGSLHVGLRGPSVAGQALVLRFDLGALFDSAAAVAAPTVVRLPVGNDRGVRDLAALPDGRLLMLSGPAREDPLPYRLDVVAADGSLQPLSSWTPKPAKAETVVVVSADQHRATLMILYDGLPDGGPELVEITLPQASAQSPPLTVPAAPSPDGHRPSKEGGTNASDAPASRDPISPPKARSERHAPSRRRQGADA